MNTLPKIKNVKAINDTMWAHVKRDGIQIHVRKTNTGVVYLNTRTPTDVTEQLKFVPSLKNVWVKMPPCQLWGELWYPSKPASYVKTAIKEQDPMLQFECFATNHFPEETGLDILDLNCRLWGIPFAPYEKCDDILEIPSDKDIEGWVYKKGNMIEWYRHKEKRTIDLIVVDGKDGKGKNLGLLGSLICKVYEGHNVADVSSGLDDEMRCELVKPWNNGELAGRIVEVTYQYVGSKGKLRHPVFVRFRDDKPAVQCCLSQDLELQAYWENQ